jgi:hypothetical protein
MKVGNFQPIILGILTLIFTLISPNSYTLLLLFRKSQIIFD